MISLISRFFDKAAIVAPLSDKNGTVAVVQTSPWRLCTVSQVEELKTLLRLCPIWASMVIFFAVTAQTSSTFIEQGMVMDNRVGSFAVPPASLASFDVISTLILIPVYDVVLVPLARRVTGKDRGLSQLQRLGIGLALSAFAMVYSALLEAKRLAVARASGLTDRSTAVPMSIMWQAPSYFIFGASNVFVCVGMLEFFYDQAPDAMKSLCTALGQVAFAAGGYLNSAVLGLVASTTARDGAPGWIPNNLNEGHLDYFFWMMAALSAMNLVLFLYCSMRYRGRSTS